MRLARVVIPVASVACGVVTALVALASCTTGDDGTSATTGDGTQQIAPSGLIPRATNCRTDADCPLYSPVCVALIPNGFRVCVERAVEATAPSMPPGQCDATRPCASGTCYAGVVYPSGVCGLGGATPENVCRADECASDADCPDGICGPPGLTSDALVSGGAIRECIAAACRSNADCTAHPGGVCGLVAGSCGATQTFNRAQVACVYVDGCFDSSDCCAGSCGTCQVVSGHGVCLQ